MIDKFATDQRRYAASLTAGSNDISVELKPDSRGVTVKEFTLKP